MEFTLPHAERNSFENHQTKSVCARWYELLFRHIFETQIHIKTQIRKTFILALATNEFL